MNQPLFQLAWKKFPFGSSQLVLLLVIAEHIADEGFCETTMSQLATAARMSRTSSWRLLDRLRASGWISIEPSPKAHGLYRIEVDRTLLEKIETRGSLDIVFPEEAAIAVADCNAVDGERLDEAEPPHHLAKSETWEPTFLTAEIHERRRRASMNQPFRRCRTPY